MLAAIMLFLKFSEKKKSGSYTLEMDYCSDIIITTKLCLPGILKQVYKLHMGILWRSYKIFFLIPTLNVCNKNKKRQWIVS